VPTGSPRTWRTRRRVAVQLLDAELGTPGALLELVSFLDGQEADAMAIAGDGTLHGASGAIVMRSLVLVLIAAPLVAVPWRGNDSQASRNRDELSRL
jgi:hypothetical protein